MNIILWIHDYANTKQRWKNIKGRTYDIHMPVKLQSCTKLDHMRSLFSESRVADFIFSRAVLCCLTWNSLGTEVSCRWRADGACTMCVWRAYNAQTMCGRHESETLLEISGGGWHMSSRTLSAGVHVIRMLSAGMYVIHMSSAALLMVSVDLNYLSTVTETGYWMEFVTRMLSCFISGSCKWFVR